MELPEVTPRRVAVAVGYLLLGVVGTAAVALLALYALEPAQVAVYRLLYLRLGPGDATVFAILLVFILAASLGLAAATLAGEYLSARGANRREVLVGLGVVAALLVLFVAASLAGLVGLPVALAWVLAAGVAVPLLLWFRYGVRSGAVPAFLGGLPVVVLMLLLAGFGIGWGWGYVVTAEPIPASSVGDAAVTTFDAVPQVRDDLFGDCEADACHLYLRGYEHEVAAVRFLADHGVHCPYQGSSAEAGSLVARRDGTYYRVTCAAHGD